MDIPDSLPPHHVNSTATSFQNPWEAKSLLASKQLLSQFPFALAKRVEELRANAKQVKVVKPRFSDNESESGVSEIKATWVGHAVCCR
jgi:hypothetical protein